LSDQRLKNFMKSAVFRLYS